MESSAIFTLPQNYAGFRDQKTYGFRTPGILESRGNLAFYQLILSASQFHNYGTIQTYDYHFFRDYLRRKIEKADKANKKPEKIWFSQPM